MNNIIVDSHQHFWDPAEMDLSALPQEIAVLNDVYLPEALHECMRKVGVDYTVCVQAYPQSIETNQWYFKQANSVDFVAGVVAWVNLQNPDDAKRSLDDLQKESKFVGIRHIVEDEPDTDWIIQKSVLESFRELARRKIPYDMLVKPKHLKNVIKVVDKINDLSLVIDHIAKPEIAVGGSPGWEDELTKIAEYNGAYCKLSGMITEADWRSWEPKHLVPYVWKVIDIFGYDRVMFGSDWPVCRLAGEYEQVWDALNEVLGSISDQQRERIFGANAVRFYDLKI